MLWTAFFFWTCFPDFLHEQAKFMHRITSLEAGIQPPEHEYDKEVSCVSTGVWINASVFHNLSFGKKSAIQRVSSTFPHFPHALLLLLKYI